MLNSPAPDFSLAASTGQQITLKEMLGSFVVLIFYPVNDTPVCDRQLKEASMNIGDFLAMGTRVFGVNTASVAKQKEYCTRKKLEYPVLSDPGGKVAKAYKAHMIWLPFNNRTVVVVDPQGIICYYQRGAPPATAILAAIKQRKAELASGAAQINAADQTSSLSS